MLQGLFLRLHIVVKVDLSRCGLLVSKPQGDDGDVDSGMQKIHRCSVSQRVPGEVFGGDGRATACCTDEVDRKAALDGVSG